MRRLVLQFLEPLSATFRRGELFLHLAFLAQLATAGLSVTSAFAELGRLLLGRLLAAPEFGIAVLALVGRADRLW
jgi:hypothetical protein